MATKSSSSGSVITAAVAGNERTRKLRAGIAQATSPNLDNRFATAGAVNFNPGAGLGVPPPLEMTGAKERDVVDTGVDLDSINSILFDSLFSSSRFSIFPVERSSIISIFSLFML